MKQRILEMINDDIKEIELNAKSEYCEELLSLLKRFIDLAKKKDKKSICEMANSDAVLLALGCSNMDLYTWEEIKDSVYEIKDIIDNWEYNDVVNHFEKLYVKNATDLEIPPVADLEAFSALGLTSIFTTYRMNTIYTVLERILEFKHKIAHDSTYISKRKEIVIRPIKAPLAPTKNTKVSLPIELPLFNPNSFQITSSKVTMSKEEIHEEIYVETQMNGVIKAYEQYYNQSIEGEKERKSIRSRIFKIYDQIKKMLEDNTIFELTNIPSEWNELLKNNVLCELYLIANDNIKKEYNKEETISESINGIINKTPLTSYLFSKGINPDSIDDKILKDLESKKMEDLKIVLDFFIKIGLNITNTFTQKGNIISELDPKKLSILNFLVDKNVLSKTTIINNLDIIINGIPKIQTNYEIIKNIIDFNNTYYDDRIIIIETTELKNRLSVLKEYNLTKNNYMYLLCNYKMLYIYDLMLENDIPLNLFISICKTSNQLNTIKRIIISKTLDIPYENKFSLKKDVLDESKFICSDEDLDMYIGSVVPYLVQTPFIGDKITNIIDNELIKQLDKTYLKSSDTYIFGTTIISRPKVLRNLEANQDIKDEDLLRIFISSSILNERNIYDIQNALQQKKLLM